MASAILRVEDVSKRFGALQACDAINIDLKPAEIHAVIGPNGAGKSTLISQICGTLAPDSGAIYLHGDNITRHLARHRARAGLARTFQVSALSMDDTVLQNVMLGALGQSGGVYRFFTSAISSRGIRDNAMNAIERVGLSDCIDTRASELSHGQRRLLEVAIALTLKPSAFIMDEPMAGLGVDGSKNLTALLDALRHEAPILLVEHDMDAVFALADRISVLVYGKVIATGSVDDIRSNVDVQEAYLGSAE